MGFRVTCKFCNSILEVYKEDIVYCELCHHSSQFTTTCAVCNNIIDLVERFIPVNIKQAIYKEYE